MESRPKRNLVDLEEVEKIEDMDDVQTMSLPVTKRRRTSKVASKHTIPTSLLPGLNPEESTDALVQSPRPRRPLRKRPTDGSRKKASSLLTPPTSAEDDNNNTDTLLQRATHVLTTEAAALMSAARLYSNCALARANLSAAVEAVTSAQRRPNNKLIFSGVGKSAYIAQKLTATSKSLGIKASFLHACEALHGDLGDIRAGDVLCFVTFSGKTPELMALLPHLPERLTVMALCGKGEEENCLLLHETNKPGRRNILLSAPIPQAEEASFGVSAPTSSTTVALAVGDMLVLTVAESLHGEKKSQVFKRNHPGGAIGMTTTMTTIEECSTTVSTSIVGVPS